MTTKTNVREYVFYAFSQISKNMTFSFFEMMYQKVAKSHTKSIKFAECL